MSNFLTAEDAIRIMQGISEKTPQGIMIGNTTVGHITWQMYLMRDYLKLDGTPLANASNDYSDLLKFAQDNNLITADTSDKSLFKYDTTNNVLTLPDFIGLVVQGGNTVEEKEAGLPNIDGSYVEISWPNSVSITDTYTGAFTSESAGSSRSGNTGSGSSTATKMIFDASRSNSIYGNSTTVQPPAIQLIPQIKYKRSTVYEGIDLNKLMPLGSIISFMGVTAPEYYLACDGTVYNINEYSILADFFETQFGTKNHFGGDGIDTFAVPDLRGEFLRGTGTNSHTNQGSGANVGEHQDGTEHSNVWGNTTEFYYSQIHGTAEDSYDSKIGNGKLGFVSKAAESGGSAHPIHYTSRPTNTSVLYCIKYK